MQTYKKQALPKPTVILRNSDPVHFGAFAFFSKEEKQIQSTVIGSVALRRWTISSAGHGWEARYLQGKNPVYTLQLSQKSDFQPSTTKPDNIGHPTVKTGQIWPLEWFWRWFSILWELKIFSFTLKNLQVIHFKSKNYEMGIKSFLKM